MALNLICAAEPPAHAAARLQVHLLEQLWDGVSDTASTQPELQLHSCCFAGPVQDTGD